VLDGGPFLLPEHVQNLPVLGLNAGSPRKDHSPQNEVWGLAWNSNDPLVFPVWLTVWGVARYSGVGGRRGCSTRKRRIRLAADSTEHLNPKGCPMGTKVFRQSSDQIGVGTRMFHLRRSASAMRSQLFDGLSAGSVGRDRSGGPS
jgi:hypothetical protein